MGKIPKRRAPKNDADWCNRFVQNSHGEPIGDKNDSWAITAEAVMGCCNLNELLKNRFCRQSAPCESSGRTDYTNLRHFSVRFFSVRGHGREVSRMRDLSF